MADLTNNLYEKLSAERKQLQREGRLPSWYLTGGWSMFKQKYLYEATDARAQFQRIAKTAAKHLIDIGVDTVKEAEEKFFEMFWSGVLSPSTPVLSNTGTNRGLPVSCQGSYIPDSIDGIYGTKRELALHTKHGFGTSAYLGDIRPRGTRISIGGKAEGVVPVLKGLIQDSQYVSQGNTRRGSVAAYFPFDHGDFDEVVDFVTATPEDANIGFNFSDHNIAKLEAQDPEMVRRFKKLMKLKMVSGRGYLSFIDKMNRLAPQAIKNSGIPIVASNLCFAGNTLVAVADGRNAVTMKQLYLEGKTFDVYSANKSRKVQRGVKSNPGLILVGSEWKHTIRKARVIKTGKKSMVRVTLENGDSFECTPDHPLATVKYGVWTEAQNALGKYLQPFFSKSVENKYRCINSTTSNKQHISIYEHNTGVSRPKGYHVNHKNDMAGDGIENLELILGSVHHKKSGNNILGINNHIHKADPEHHSLISSNSAFLHRNGRYCGLTDLDLVNLGKTYARKNKFFRTKDLLDFFSIHGGPTSLSKNRFQQFKSAGYNSRGDWLCALVSGNSEYIPPVDHTSGIIFNRDKVDNYNPHYATSQKTVKYTGLKVVKVETLGVKSCYDVQVLDSDLDYDQHNFYIITGGNKNSNYRDSRGVLVHNCNEISLPSNKEYSFVCVLSSMNLVHWDRLKTSDDIFWATIFLDCINSEFISKAKNIPGLEKSVKFAQDFAALGLGACGLHTLFQQNMIPWESFQAHQLNNEIFARMDSESRRASEWLAEKRGCVKFTEGTGMRNATRLAIAPTKSTALLMGGVSEGINPDPAMTYTQASAGGDLLRVNALILSRMRERGAYKKSEFDSINAASGSVQHVSWLTAEEKEVFKTAFELNMESVIRMGSARQRSIDQGQSLNLFFSANEDPRWIAHIHRMAMLDERIKGLYYVYSTRTLKGASRECVACQ